MAAEEQLCDHLANVHEVKPLSTRGCEECLKRGDSWVHLRLCMECGNVGCCDEELTRWLNQGVFPDKRGCFIHSRSEAGERKSPVSPAESFVCQGPLAFRT